MHYTYFLEKGPYDAEADSKRRFHRLPLAVFYAGETELNIIANYLNLNML